MVTSAGIQNNKIKKMGKDKHVRCKKCICLNE